MGQKVLIILLIAVVKMETITLIIAVASLVVMVATLVFMVKNSKGYLRSKLRKKEERYERLNGITHINPFSSRAGVVKNKHFEERDKLEKEIEDLKDRL